MHQTSFNPRDPELLHCFKIPVAPHALAPEWLSTWRHRLANEKFKIASVHEEALARLVPLLLCGEQSAIQVFGREVERLRTGVLSNSISLLVEIETDEHAHEQALQVLSSSLMRPTDLHLIKRKARHFYLGLGETSNIVEHFARISQLDSCVCVIMHAISRCGLGSRHPIAHLFKRIGKDEARHVSICRKHFRQLGGDRSSLAQIREIVGAQIVTLLRTEANSFEALGMDPDSLFRKLVSA